MNIITFLRSFRIGPFAIFDFAVSFLAVYFLAPYLQKMGLKLSRVQMLWLTIPVSILVHILVGSQTPLTKMFIDPSGGYIVKLVFVLMVFMGFWSK
ncbi:MAG: hypothetical protein NTX63_00650 [Candidatus Peregrinibacteria bacterium]|nr:hypothetical protein [Candidatus Peregrinibacteria bacterium]